MGNARIIHIKENIFKNKSTKNNLFKREVSSNSTINNPTILRIEDDVYAGEVKDGKPNGKGILRYYHNGKAEGRYVGEFKDGKRDGEGKWEIKGCSYEGEWKLDSCHGRGKFINQGDVQEGWWFMGNFECHYGDELKPCNYVEIKK